MPPGALIIHLFSIQMPPGAGGGGETVEGALGPLFPAGTWRASSGPARRPGSPDDSGREASHSPLSVELPLAPRLQPHWDSLTICPPGLMWE